MRQSDAAGTLVAAADAGGSQRRQPRANVVVLGTALQRECIVCRLQSTPGWETHVFRSIIAWPKRMATLGEAAEEALTRVAAARGCPVPDTPEQREWVRRSADRHPKAAPGTSLLLSTRELPAAPALAGAARAAGRSVHARDELPPPSPGARVVYYGRTDVVIRAAAHYRLALLEPRLDLLARLPAPLLLRRVEFARFRELARLKRPTFVKPADPLDRCFDAGVYADARVIRAP